MLAREKERQEKGKRHGSGKPEPECLSRQFHSKSVLRRKQKQIRQKENRKKCERNKWDHQFVRLGQDSAKKKRPNPTTHKLEVTSFCCENETPALAGGGSRPTLPPSGPKAVYGAGLSAVSGRERCGSPQSPRQRRPVATPLALRISAGLGTCSGSSLAATRWPCGRVFDEGLLLLGV